MTVVQTTTSAREAGAVETVVRTVPFGRTIAATALVIGAGLNTAESVLGRALLGEKPEKSTELMALLAQNEGTRTLVSVLGTLAIPFMFAGFIALAHLLRRGARRTANAALALLGLGMWGFLGMHIVSLTEVPVLRAVGVEQAAAVMDEIQSTPLLGALFLVPFLAGTFVGMVTLALGLLKTRVLPGWIPAALLTFIVLDFSVGPVGLVDPHWLWLAAAAGAAAAILRMGEREWSNA